MPPEIMEDMADAAGDAALEAYQTALDAGEDPSVAASQAIDAASTVMTEMGAPADMVDTMASAAQDGFDSALADNFSIFSLDKNNFLFFISYPGKYLLSASSTLSFTLPMAGKDIKIKIKKYLNISII